MNENLLLEKKKLLEEIKKNDWAFMKASKELLADKEFMIEAAKKNGGALELASDELKKDKELVISAVREQGRILRYAAEELKGDKEFVLQAMRGKYDISLLLASERLQKDTDVVLESISNGLLRTMQYKLKCDIKDIEKKREIIKKNIESILLKKYEDKDILKAVEDTEKYENLEEILETIKK